jgi:hypothetical protein
MDPFIHIRSTKFPILPGEEEELINEGTYGKALAQYVQAKLKDRGYDVPCVLCEDWGWWVELGGAPFVFGVCVYTDPGSDAMLDFVCAAGVTGRKQWSWKKFRFLDTSPWADKLVDDLIAIFQEDDEVELVGITEEFPLG